MEFLDNSVLPQSANHLTLLKYLLALAYALFISYLSLLFGSLFFSVVYNRKGNKTGNPDYVQFSKELIDLATMKKSIAIALGVVPFMSIILSYTQLIHSAGSFILNGFVISFVLFIVAIVLVYTYKYSFHISELLGLLSSGELNKSNVDPKLAEEAGEYKNVAGKLYYKSGLWGLILLSVSAYIFVGTIQAVSDSTTWASAGFYDLLFSVNTLIYFAYFVTAGFGFTFTAFLYYYYKLNKAKNDDEDYRAFARKEASKTGMVSTILVPLFLAVSVILTPEVALSGRAVITVLVSLICLMFISSLFYVTMKESQTQNIHYAFYLFIIVFMLVVIKDQLNYDITSQKQMRILAADYIEYQNKLKEEMGIDLIEISGADIYNGRCSACHQFDIQLVGPSYNSVMPKYEGQRNELVGFILNPVKVDDSYPPMPNQGLKPKEAEAVADYIIQMYKEQNNQ